MFHAHQTEIDFNSPSTRPQLVHANSRAVYARNRRPLGGRAQEILENLRQQGAGMDRSVATRMGLDYHVAQPRISDLIRKGYVVEIGTEKCGVTGTRVRVVKAAL